MRKIKFSEGEYYHIYNRGIEKRIIFLDRNDYDRFMLLLDVANSKKPVHLQKRECSSQGGASTLTNPGILDKGESLVEIGAYCLMPNHFHLLLKEKQNEGIRLFMHKISTAYTMYFNKKYERVGPLFQGVFKAQHADSDEYLKYLFSYIHLNPIKLIDPKWKERGLTLRTGIVLDYLAHYEHSSFMDLFVGNRGERNILNIEEFPEYFINKKDFLDNIFNWLSFGAEIKTTEV